MFTEPTALVTTIIAVLSVLFNVYQYFHKPQEQLATHQAVVDKANEGQEKLFTAQIAWERENNHQRFSEMGKRLDDAFALAQNHTHTIDVKVDELIKVVNAMNVAITNELTELRTTIKLK